MSEVMFLFVSSLAVDTILVGLASLFARYLADAAKPFEDEAPTRLKSTRSRVAIAVIAVSAALLSSISMLAIRRFPVQEWPVPAAVSAVGILGFMLWGGFVGWHLGRRARISYTGAVIGIWIGYIGSNSWARNVAEALTGS